MLCLVLLASFTWLVLFHRSSTKCQGCQARSKICLDFYADFASLTPRVARVLGTGVVGLTPRVARVLGFGVAGLAPRVTRVSGAGITGLIPRVAQV